ncbi:lysophospholipid acyltransferase family protein [Geitlerinema sp. CS-897]|uniref:lysophospholipid acyltransferase family protein n=1 Tax=Baaleninema simplex TaxID=2862350 RepID=UPI00037DD275|nr:lysophospholipid acyltransferase family protein [Baaleninema simplex]MDC0834829.1 lysophospholipid acyltransferase family protein [Geitlerinema sp. CS-897]
MGRNREPGISLALYHLFKWSVVSPMLHGYFRGRVFGIENVPKSGPVVVASNHASFFDPPIVACSVRRPVAFMAKEELFSIPVFKQAIQLYGAYPVKRKAVDRQAIRQALDYLENGWATGIFLSGTRTRDGKIPHPQLGAALIAAKAQAPVLPVSLWGTQDIFPSGSKIPRPVPVTVRIGEAIAPPENRDRETLQAFTQDCADRIERLHALGR